MARDPNRANNIVQQAKATASDKREQRRREREEREFIAGAPRGSQGTLKATNQAEATQVKRTNSRMLGVRLPDALLEELDELVEDRRSRQQRPWMRTEIVEAALRSYLKRAQRT